jgi:hypothetical protein
VLVRTRRVHRHRDHTRVQAAEERRDELHPGRVEHQRALAGQAQLGQPRRDGPGPQVERGVVEPVADLLAAGQEHQRRPLRAGLGAQPQQPGQGVDGRGRWAR